MKNGILRPTALLLALTAVLLCLALLLGACGGGTPDEQKNDTTDGQTNDSGKNPTDGTDTSDPGKTDDPDPQQPIEDDPLEGTTEGDGIYGGDGNPQGDGSVNPGTTTPIDPFR